MARKASPTVVAVVEFSAIRWPDGDLVRDADRGDVVELPRDEFDRLFDLGAVREAVDADFDEEAPADADPADADASADAGTPDDAEADPADADVEPAE